MGSQSPSDFIWPKFNNSLFIFQDDIWITSRREKLTCSRCKSPWPNVQR
jgi:hypothetical protein